MGGGHSKVKDKFTGDEGGGVGERFERASVIGPLSSADRHCNGRTHRSLGGRRGAGGF